ncbi:MAG: thioredoxin-disulfide reductase [Bacillota bacterium]|nr:MAG: thioredoxin-disulfide reductase [Bacillota bacterium]
MSDIIVIGAGAAGMTAALYALRNGKSITVLEEETFGGQIANSPRVENFPTVKEISGGDLADRLFEQITALGAEVELEKALGIEKKGKGFVVKTEYAEREAKSVIIAAGVKHKHLRFANEEELTGNGISYCAICDGPFYTGEEVALVGDGNTALQYGILLSGYCPKVYVYTLFDRFFGDEALVKTLLSKKNVIWKPNTALTEYIGSDKLEGFRYKENGEIKEHRIGALFVAIGQVPDNKKFANLVELDRDGYVAADETCATSCDGVFVAGDCRAKKIRQLTTAAADGAVSALAACAYIDKNF